VLPDKPSPLSPPDGAGHVRARPDEHPIGALEALADEFGPAPRRPDSPSPRPATGAVNPDTLGDSLSALLSEQAIVLDAKALSKHPLHTARSF